MAEFTEKFKLTDLATTVQTETITLTKGTYRSIVSVIIAVGDVGNEWLQEGYFEVHRTDGTPDDDSNIGETYLNTNNMILISAGEEEMSKKLLKLKIDHNAGTTKNVYIDVTYKYTN